MVMRNAPRTELLSLAFSIVSSWSNVEQRQRDFIILMLGGNASVATAAYLALDGKSAKNAVLLACAKKSLNSEELAYLKAIIKASSSFMKFRNKLAHWSIARVEGIGGHLALKDPDDDGEGTSAHNGIYLFSKNELITQKKASETVWKCYHRLICLYNAKGNPASDESYMHELRHGLSNLLLTLDKELLLPLIPPIS